MLQILFDWLKSVGFDFPGMNLFRYISFKAALAGSISIITSMIAGKKIIRLLRKKQIGETIRDLGLQGQMEKKGTPTMGGIMIIFSLMVAVLLVCDLRNVYVQLLIASALFCGGLGFADDYVKVFRHDKGGLSEGKKLAFQFILGLFIALMMCFSKTIHTDQVLTTIPFIKEHEFDYSWLSPFGGQFGVYCTWGIYMLVIIFVILSCTNGANLTDGLDGLATGVSTTIAVVIGVIAWLSGDILDSKYLNIMYLPGTGEVAVFMAAFAGALTGFLWYNTYPAQVFMGDTGSLMIGGVIGVGAVLIRKELLLPVLCGIFLVESMSVLIQRYWFKYTKKKYGEGRRVFLMAPLHHHYQKKGVPEPRISMRFIIVSMLLSIGTLAILKIR